MFCPYWPHLKEAWNRRHHPNLNFVFYENLKKDTMAEVVKLNEFLGTKLTEEQLKNVSQV